MVPSLNEELMGGLCLCLVVTWDPGKDGLLDVEDWSQAFSSDVGPSFWASWNASIGSLSREQSLAHWHKVLHGVSLADFILLLALSDRLIPLGLVSLWLVAIHTSVKESSWAFVGANGVTKTDESRVCAFFIS
jgi:hypothetical protein